MMIHILGFGIAHEGDIPYSRIQFRTSEFVCETVRGTLRSMMYDPNVFIPDLQQLLSIIWCTIECTIPVVQITVEAARGLKGQDR